MKRPHITPVNANVTKGMFVSGPVPVNSVRNGNVIATVGIVTPDMNATRKGRRNTIRTGGRFASLKKFTTSGIAPPA